MAKEPQRMMHPDDLAVLLAQRLYELYSQEHPQLLPTWNAMEDEDRRVWCRVAARLIMEAREEQREWVRESMLQQVERLRQDIRDGGALLLQEPWPEPKNREPDPPVFLPGYLDISNE